MINHRLFARNILLHLISSANNSNLYVVELRQYDFNCEDALPITMHCFVADEALPYHVIIYFHYLAALDPEVVYEFVFWVHGEGNEG